jgi:glycosyltransferase involved in cell wall biosynthesis
LRVLHLGKFFPPHPGGIERFCADLAGEQLRQGLQPSVLAHGHPASAPDDHPFPVSLVRSHGRLLFVPVSPGWPLAMRAAMAAWHPQLLHVHLPNPSAFWLLVMPKARALPWVVHWHADIPDDTGHAGLRAAYPLYRQFERQMLDRAALVIATSQRYADASGVLQRVPHKLRVLPLGLAGAPAPGVAPAWPQPGLRLLAVGRLSYYKGFDTLIRALAGVTDASLLLIGSGEQQRAIEQQVRDSGVGDRVRLLGQVDDATLEAAYRACDVLCLPSVDRSEAFGLVLLEAMRAGKPVLASDIPGSGVGEVVADGQSGRLVPLRDVDGWRTAIRRMAAATDEREAMGRTGLARWQQHFRIDAVTARLTTIYREVTGDRVAGTPAAPSRTAATAPDASTGD